MKQPRSTQFDFVPVIIIGAARSGTNMLRDALTQFDSVASWPCDEINPIWRHGNRAHPTDELPPRLAISTVRRYIRNSFCALADRTGASWIVEKTCANSLRVDFVRAVLPECKFIFLVRDGRDAVASAMKRWAADFDFRYAMKKARFVPAIDLPYYTCRVLYHRWHRVTSRERRLPTWGPRFSGIDELLDTSALAEVCARQWSECVLRAARSLARLPLDVVCVVRYESLANRPSAELSRIATFLGLSNVPSDLASIAKQITKCSIGKWRSDVDAEAIDRLQPLIESTLLQFRRWMPDGGELVGQAS